MEAVIAQYILTAWAWRPILPGAHGHCRLHAMMFPYLFFILFSSFLAESHGADCPSKKLWKKEEVTLSMTKWTEES